jgi:hypothetical protein
MKILLWHSPGLDQWRWTLNTSFEEYSVHETGNATNIRAAMNDIANTVEYHLSKGGHG